MSKINAQPWAMACQQGASELFVNLSVPLAIGVAPYSLLLIVSQTQP
jgi:hypothetical protein